MNIVDLKGGRNKTAEIELQNIGYMWAGTSIEHRAPGVVKVLAGVS